MKWIAGMVACLLAAGSASAQVESWSLYPFVERYTWVETVDGETFMSEDGYLEGLAAELALFYPNTRIPVHGRAELFGGRVDYDGKTQPDQNAARSEVSCDTEVQYFGTKLDADLGLRAGASATSFEPIVGLGYRIWYRGIERSTITGRDGQTYAVSGTGELWQILYGSVGARGRHLTSGGVRIFAEARAKYPFMTRVLTSYKRIDVTLSPEPRWSFFGETGLSYKRLRTSVFYEDFRIGSSPARGYYGVWQPETIARIVGLSLGLQF